MIGRFSTRLPLLCALALLGAVSLAQAQQQWPGSSSYPQPSSPPQPNVQRASYQTPDYYGYYLANSQPVKQAQASYPAYMNPAYPPSSYYYPRMNPYMYTPGVPQGGWNFNYTPPNPLLPGQSSYNTPVYAAPYRPTSHAPAGTNWPAPTATSYPLPAEDPSIDRKVPPLPFHRPTRETFFVSADYTMGFMHPMRVGFALATIGNAQDFHPAAVGQPGTTVVYGNNNIDFNMFSGGRLTMGMYLDCANRFSTEVSGLWMASNSQAFNQSSDAAGNPVLARPIFNVADGAFREGTLLTAFPALFAGSLSIVSKSQLGGIEFNGRYHTYSNQCWHTDCLVGLRYMRLSESMHFTDQLTPLDVDQLTFLGASVNPPNSLTDQDLFRTSNEFFGTQFGYRACYEMPWCTIEGFAKVGLGATEQRISISGVTTLVTPTGNTTTPGGILAQPTNIGTYSRTVFGILPEFGFNFGVDVTDHIRMKVGYSLLMWNHVVRPAGQIDRNVNPGQVPGSPNFGMTTGPSSPAFRFNDEFFWSHFFNLGFEMHF